jgi:hypothetical protein
MIFISIIGFQSFLVLQVYLIVAISSVIFINICYRFPEIGYHQVCMLLERHATPELFALIKNFPFKTFFAKVTDPAKKAIAKHVGIAVGVFLGANYIAFTTGLHQFAGHVTQDMFNEEKTVFISMILH